MLKKIIRIILIIIIVTLLAIGVWVKSNWDFVNMKYRFEDYFLSLGYFSPEEKMKAMTINIKDKELKDIKARLTNIVYSPDHHKLYFGTLCNKFYFEKRNLRPLSYFFIEFEDEKGNKYIEHKLQIISGMFETFILWGFENIDISKTGKLYMNIYPFELTDTGMVRQDPIRVLIMDAGK